MDLILSHSRPLKIVSISPEHKIDSPKEAQSEIKDENMSNDLVKQVLTCPYFSFSNVLRPTL